MSRSPEKTLYNNCKVCKKCVNIAIVTCDFNNLIKKYPDYIKIKNIYYAISFKDKAEDIFKKKRKKRKIEYEEINNFQLEKTNLTDYNKKINKNHIIPPLLNNNIKPNDINIMKMVFKSA